VLVSDEDEPATIASVAEARAAIDASSTGG
jgi:hypothetical protein